MKFTIHPFGDFAFVVRFPNCSDSIAHDTATSLARRIGTQTFPGIVECVAASGILTLFYDPLAMHTDDAFDSFPLSGSRSLDFPNFQEELRRFLELLIGENAKGISRDGVFTRRTIELPVCYGGAFGADLEFVARHTQLTPEQVIQLHTSSDYSVEMIGFAPGFPYLGGLSPRLATPRRATPRLCVARGSVGIGGTQTGVYSIDTPGGWQIIGRTPISLFRPKERAPSLLRAGDRVRFRSITRSEFESAPEVVMTQE